MYLVVELGSGPTESHICHHIPVAIARSALQEQHLLSGPKRYPERDGLPGPQADSIRNIHLAGQVDTGSVLKVKGFGLADIGCNSESNRILA